MPDSRPATYEHIDRVRALMTLGIHDMIEKARVHDASKLVSPEVEVFDVITERLHGLTYDSPEYHASMAEFRAGLDHHVTQNSHHPEAHEDGVQGMTLLELFEMACDWTAASERHEDGDVIRSIREANPKRFGYGPEITRLLENTVLALREMEARAAT
jgi:hypothetical protein